MTQKIHGTSSAHQNLTADLQNYVVYTSSPLAFSDPENATGVDILVTNNIADDTQKNFEILIQGIGLRAMPVIMNDPLPIEDLAVAGAPSLTGEGYVWKFVAEFPEAFRDYKVVDQDSREAKVGLLISELNGIVLETGVVLDTFGVGINIEFDRIVIL